MNMKDELFNEFDIDLETANRIAKEYPSLSDSARERMFNMTKEKMNITNDANEANNNSVHGVEKYNRPRWIKFAGMAAAVAIIAGGVGGGSYLLHNMNKTAPSTSSSSETEVTTTSSVITDITTTAAVVETTTVVTEVKDLTPEEAAHKLTDNYWDYECFFDQCARTKADYESVDSVKLKYTYQYDGWFSDAEITYYKTIDERLTDKTMDGLKKMYNTYYGKNYDPFYSVNAEYTHNYELFGPSYTVDTLPTEIDRAYTYIEYEGELYQFGLSKDYITGNHWSDDQIDITDATETSFTLKRKFNNEANAMHDEIHGEVTFKIVFDEAAQDWRIEQKDVEYEYQNTGATENNDNNDNSSEVSDEIRQAADELLSQYPTIDRIEWSGEKLTDDVIYDSNNNDWPYFAVEPGFFADMEFLKNYYYSVVTPHYSEQHNNLALWGPEIAVDENDPTHIKLDQIYMFITYNGKLYGFMTQGVGPMKADSWTDDPTIFTNVTSDSFDMEKYFIQYDGERVSHKFHVIKDSAGKWLIDSVF